MPANDTSPEGWRALQPAEVQVWCGEVPAAPEEARLAAVAACLTPEERARSRRFRFPRDARVFVFARAMVRCLVGRHLGLAPQAVRFETGPFGKPFVREESARPAPRFNASHSGERVLVALAADRELGIDVEALRPMPDALEIAQRFFAAGERRQLAALSAAEREVAFFECWTRKEAYVKATGEGLSATLDDFEVAFGPGPRLDLSSTRVPPRPMPWTLHALDAGAGYRAALVIEGEPAAIDCRRIIAPGCI